MRWFRLAWLGWLTAIAYAATGCAVNGGGPDCRVGADCASGVCLSNGECMPPDHGDAAASRDGGSGTETTPDAAGFDGGGSSDGHVGFDEGGAPGCSPNHDGVIERHEVPIMVGLRATYRVARDVEVDTAGTERDDDTRRWDFTGPYAGDRSVLVEAQSMEGTWYAEDFPGADYASLLDSRDNLLGVFETTANQLLLRGVVSFEDGFTRTNVEHDPPVEMLRFPLEPGKEWTSSASVRGTYNGTPVSYRERYEMQVDAVGELTTPFGDFPVQRVRVVMTRTVGITTTVVRTFMFVTECFGTVATAVSEDNERREEFSEAAEIRRLAP